MMRTLLILGALLLASCGSVKAWERETLAHPCMSDETRPEERRARAHMLVARESSQGAVGETGGGCGCK